MKALFAVILFFLLSPGLLSQSNFKGIYVQVEHEASLGQLDIEVLITDSLNDTLWLEVHPNITMSSERTYSFVLGMGQYLAGNFVMFEEINWLDVDKIILSRVDGGVNYVLTELTMHSVPYALHSKVIEYVPTVIQLNDVSDQLVLAGSLLKFDGANFYPAVDLLGDTAQFAFQSGNTVTTDTAFVGIPIQSYTDTAQFAFSSDSANYTNLFEHVFIADTVHVADTVGSEVQSALGNWSISGDAGIISTDFVGTNDNIKFQLGTNNITRMVFDNDHVYNSLFASGFGWNANNGFLVQPGGTSAIQSIAGSYLFFEGSKRAFSGGETILGLDTLLGDYSFTWGKNVGSNGPYSTLFGNNSHGDSTTFSSGSPAVSGFSVGKDNSVSYVGVAIGENCQANFYRNVAIGWNCIANTNSANVAIGANVTVTGATSWAMGKNLIANGHFSTLLGSYVSNNGFNGGFLFGDFSSTSNLLPTAINQFMVRSAGGVIIYSSSNLSSGVTLSAGGGSWNMISDRTKKNFTIQLDPFRFNEKFNRLNTYSWTYRNQNITHVGPMAQDVFGIFNIGEYNTYINMLDMDGITILGIKLIYERLQMQPKEQDYLNIKSEISTEKAEMKNLENRIQSLYDKMDK